MANLLHELLSECATAQPSVIAVEEKDRRTNYADLDENSTRLAMLLADIGVLRGDRVGLLLHKSMEAYLGIYAIMKAGGAYVPIDRRSPAERIAYQVGDCDIKTLVVTSHTLEMVPEIEARGAIIDNVVCLDEAPGVPCAARLLHWNPAQAPEHQLPHLVDTDLAYILYTSGSTGRPKGVLISHAVSISFVKWSCKAAGVQPGDRVSGHAPLHFDLSVFDIFATSLAGGTLLPVPDGTSTFPGMLLNWISANRISVWYSVPSILSLMAQQKRFPEKDLSRLRVILFAGEVFPVPYLQAWLKTFPEIIYQNWFGPTETNVITSYTVTMAPDELDRPVPIGKATDNADLFLIDENGDRVSGVGRVGELCARGPCVALGYWGDREKTALRFFDNFESPWLRDRVCRTGDLVSLDREGNYLYQGRMDHMIKSRGYRIELGEIEAALFKCDKLVDAAVVPVPDEVIGNRLVAYVELEQGAELDGEAIRVIVAEHVPRYMIPETVEILESMPKTSNGKVDRQALAKRVGAD